MVEGTGFENEGDTLSEAGIIKNIRTTGVFQVEVRETVTSTNTVLCEMAGKGVSEGFVLAANEQTAGKGRFGRKFYSPAGHGVYFSLLLRLGSKAENAGLITSAAAVAAARAINEIFGVQVGIKWVNDLFLGDKKVCGILTEAVFGTKIGMVESAVLGIGTNITRPEQGFGGLLDEVATAIAGRNRGENNERCRFIAAVLDNFWEFYQDLEGRKFLDEYRARSIVLGKDIRVLSDENQRCARAIDIDDECGLVVRFEDGEMATLNSGEVSIRVAGSRANA
jgi:BirA family biotin operon repressor/biotin-[acetyl-CoA-carboxylase] ligase